MAKKRQWLLGVSAAGMVCAAAPAAWADADPLVEGARLCTQNFPIEERTNQIPTHLLAAIATTESGRYHEGLGMNVPWPWTINVEGKGYYFNSKAEAIAQTRQFISEGRESIDVGCMQVNLKHHPKAFATLEEAFDPKKNVGYAARFLRTNYADLGDWIKATAAYHSRTPRYGARYLGEIERSWNNIVGKVAAARAGTAGTQVASRTSRKKSNIIATAAPKITVPAAVVKPHQPSQARVIEVREVANYIPAHTRHESQVVVVNTPAPAPAPMAEAASAAAVAPAAGPAPVGNSIRQVRLAPAASSPTYVFAN